MEKETNVFISYAREDHTIAYQIYNDLKNRGYNPWIDKENLLPGENWKNAIHSVIKEAQYFIALLSSNSISKKGFVQRELRLALDMLEEFPENRIFIIPVRLEDCRVSHSKLEDINWVDIFPSYTDGLNRIFKTLDKDKKESKYTTGYEQEDKRIFYQKYSSLATEIYGLCRKKLLFLKNSGKTIIPDNKFPLAIEVEQKREELSAMFNKIVFLSPKDVCQPAQRILITLILCDSASYFYAESQEKQLDKYFQELLEYRDCFIEAARCELGLDPFKILPNKEIQT